MYMYIHVNVHVHVYGGADLYDLRLMHCDAVVRVLRQLVQSTGSGSVDESVRGVEVGHQWSHCSLFTKCNTIVTPHAAPGRWER